MLYPVIRWRVIGAYVINCVEESSIHVETTSKRSKYQNYDKSNIYSTEHAFITAKLLSSHLLLTQVKNGLTNFHVIKIRAMDIKIIHEFLDIARKDQKAEFECSVLPGKIQTKDVADRLLNAIKTISLGPPTETSILRVMYPEDIRVEVQTPQLIQRVCSTGSFKGVPLTVIKKKEYNISKNTVDVPDLYSRFRLRLEEPIRKDWEASPNDPRVGTIRLLNRRSYKTTDEFFQIDFSMVKTRKSKKQTLRDVLKEQQVYELEIEFIKRNTDVKSEDIAQSLLKLINALLQGFQESEFLLTPANQERYLQEFRMSKSLFFNPVTLQRRTLKEDRPHNIWKDYTVTVKADGERFGLFVSRDKKLLRINSKVNTVVWTGLSTNDDSYIGDFIDGEYIKDKNLFCIFDIYRYKGRDVQSLPLMKTDSPSRLDFARMFVADLNTKFITEATINPIRIETKLFLAGDGAVMEQAIQQLLDADYEYETDGLIFTPRLSPVAPPAVRNGNRWSTVYKWKPPTQNSIDFLIKLSDEQTYDPVIDSRVRKGELYVGRSSYDSVLYPCETLTGEYVPKQLPEDLQSLAKSNTYIPSLFQPSNPREPDAYQIMIPVDEKGLAYDSANNRVEDNTIIECAYDVEKRRWIVMRTRYDKTYEYRVVNKTQYGNERSVADDIWSSIHIPVSEEMIRKFASIPVDDSQEDEVYYKEDINRKARILQPSYDFHNRVKDDLYTGNVKRESTLLEFGVGQAGDYNRWKRTHVGRVVGIDPATRGLKEACRRYLTDKQKFPSDYRPAVLFVEGTMNEPLYEQESQKFKLLSGTEKASTKYLEQFEDLKKFDASSSQFNIHYACESEEVFRVFVKNVDTHTKNVFFGTCLDGQAVYSLLMGKQTHIFTNGKDVGGEYTKEYDDKETWVEEFGMPIKVSMESFEKPAREYLVPFGKVVDIMKEHGFDLKESTLFSELYSRQTKITLTPEQQTFSFLNRTFVFARGEKPKPEAPPPSDEAVPAPTEKKPRKLKKKEGGAVEKPVLFSGPGEDKGEFRTFSNQAEYPIQISDVRYPTVEHYFQAMKAREFGDTEIEKKIEGTPSAKAVKALGKKVKNFIKEVWDSKRIEIMTRGVKAKFVQHPELQKQLLDTGDRIIGEADARNSFWGIGTSENTEKSGEPSKWKGQNQMGKLLMALRDDFKG